MDINERQGRDKETPETYSAEAGPTVPAVADQPTRPKSMSEDEAESVRSQAIELVKQLEDAGGVGQLELLDRITSVGTQAQRDAAGQLELLQARIGTFLNEGGTGAEIADGLRDLRLSLDRINPHKMTQPGLGDRIFGVLPFFKGRYNPVLRAVNKIALRYEPVSRQVTNIEASLREGQALLVRDNVELRKLYEDVEDHQPRIQRNGYLGELLAERISQLVDQTDDPIKRDRLQGALHDVVTRVQDMRTMEETHLQYFVSIEMSWQNNNRLRQAVERTLSLATNVVTVGLAIQTALIRQKKVSEANGRTREFLGDLVAANAAAIRRHTDEIGDAYNSPVISMDKIAQAHDNLVEALDAASRLRRDGIQAARVNISKLTKLTADLEKRVAGLPKEPESLSGSIEA